MFETLIESILIQFSFRISINSICTIFLHCNAAANIKSIEKLPPTVSAEAKDRARIWCFWNLQSPKQWINESCFWWKNIGQRYLEQLFSMPRKFNPFNRKVRRGHLGHVVVQSLSKSCSWCIRSKTLKLYSYKVYYLSQLYTVYEHNLNSTVLSLVMLLLDRKDYMRWINKIYTSQFFLFYTIPWANIRYSYYIKAAEEGFTKFWSSLLIFTNITSIHFYCITSLFKQNFEVSILALTLLTWKSPFFYILTRLKRRQ